MELKKIEVFTDGSAVSNGVKKGQGGYGIYLIDGKSRRYFKEGFIRTKIGRMELTAVLKTLGIIKEDYKDPISLVIYSDSEYVVKSFTEGRLAKWVANNWTNTSGNVKNRDLWEQVVNLLEELDLDFKIVHVKGHQIDKVKKADRKQYLKDRPIAYGNFVADFLADYKSHKVQLSDIPEEEWNESINK